MKLMLISWTLFLSLTSSTTLALAEEFPAWLKEHAKAKNKIRRVIRYEHDGAYYYLISYSFPDSYENLYDANGQRLCAPSGGLSGRGYGKCPDFLPELKDGTVIPNDSSNGSGSESPKARPNHEDAPDRKPVR